MLYSDRFKLGLMRPGKSRAGVAKAMGVSVQAISAITRGMTKAPTAANNAAAAIYFGCDPTWLATGKGSPHWADEDTQPDVEVMPEKIITLDEALDRIGQDLAHDMPPDHRDELAEAMSTWCRYKGRHQYRHVVATLLAGPVAGTARHSKPAGELSTHCTARIYDLAMLRSSKHPPTDDTPTRGKPADFSQPSPIRVIALDGTWGLFG